MAKPQKNCFATDSTIKGIPFPCSTRRRFYNEVSVEVARATLKQSELSIEFLLCCRCLFKTVNPITKAEYEVVCQFVKGYSYKEIANQRQVSCETVKSQINCVLAKTDTRNRMALLMLVLELNISRLKVTQARLPYS